MLVRYFVPSKAIQNITGEIADVLTNCIMEVLNKFHIMDKIVAFCKENCNTNFGGAGRKGQNCAFSTLKSLLKITSMI